MSMDIDDPRSDRLPGRIVHVRALKPTGTASSKAFRRIDGNHLCIYPAQYEPEYGQTDYSEFDFYGGHIGFNVACENGENFITVLRDPIVHCPSAYFCLRQRYISREAINEFVSVPQ